MEWKDEAAPTHRCNKCGALWRYWPRRDTGCEDSWSLRSTACGQCCDNAPMGGHIEPLTLGEMGKYLKARLAVDAMTQHMLGPKDGDAVN
jgi:hypothetical protein